MRFVKFAPALLAALVGFAAEPAVAADMPAKPVYKAPVADMFNPWMIRLRALGVVTRNSGVVDQVAGSGLATTSAVVTYTVFFSQTAGITANGAGVIITRSQLHNSFAPAVQVVFDYMFDRHW